jgi:hypothetical protein
MASPVLSRDVLSAASQELDVKWWHPPYFSSSNFPERSEPRQSAMHKKAHCAMRSFGSFTRIGDAIAAVVRRLSALFVFLAI